MPILPRFLWDSLSLTITLELSLVQFWSYKVWILNTSIVVSTINGIAPNYRRQNIKLVKTALHSTGLISTKAGARPGPRSTDLKKSKSTPQIIPCSICCFKSTDNSYKPWGFYLEDPLNPNDLFWDLSPMPYQHKIIESGHLSSPCPRATSWYVFGSPGSDVKGVVDAAWGGCLCVFVGVLLSLSSRSTGSVTPCFYGIFNQWTYRPCWLPMVFIFSGWWVGLKNGRSFCLQWTFLLLCFWNLCFIMKISMYSGEVQLWTPRIHCQ